MICPFCKNRGWVPRAGIDDPVELLNHGVERIEGGTLRRHTCHNCGASFYSLEELNPHCTPMPLQLELFRVTRSERDSYEECLLCGEKRVAHLRTDHYDFGTVRQKGCRACHKKYETVQKLWKKISAPEDLVPVRARA